jgi:hypothetical protein
MSDIECLVNRLSKIFVDGLPVRFVNLLSVLPLLLSQLINVTSSLREICAYTGATLRSQKTCTS